MIASSNGASVSVWLDTADVPACSPLLGDLDTEVA